MNKVLAVITLSAVMIASCSPGAKEKKGSLNDKKVQLAKMKAEHEKLNKEIAKLQEEINQLDPKSNVGNAKLVSVMPLTTQDFNHYIDLQGKIDAENISYVTPRGGPGQVKAVYVKEGQFVKKGQLLLKLEDAVMLQNISQMETQLAFAKNIFERQKNLWEQGIGTEVQYITAKNNVTQAEKQLATLKEQWQHSFVKAEVSGIADEVNIHVGETFTGSPLQGIKIVNTAKLKIVADIPENYISRVRTGSPVQILVPDLNNRLINSSVSLVSQSIDPKTRGFIVEAKISNGTGLKPNQVAIMKILDYAAKNAIVVPVNTVQSEEKGKFVYVMEKKEDKMIATKKSVNVGELYGELIEIKAGLKSGDQLITEGFQNLYEGQVVATDIKS